MMDSVHVDEEKLRGFLDITPSHIGNPPFLVTQQQCNLDLLRGPAPELNFFTADTTMLKVLLLVSQTRNLVSESVTY